MQAYLNMKTGTKLTLAFALMLAFFFTSLLASQWSLRQLQASQERLSRDILADLLEIKNLNADLNSARAGMLLMSLVREESDRAELRQSILATVERNQRSLDKLSSRANGDPERTLALQSLRQLWLEYDRIRREQVLPDIEAGRIDSARGLIQGGQTQRINAIRELGDRLSTIAEEQVNVLLAKSDGLIRRQQSTIVIFCVAATLFSGLIIWSMNRTVAAPLLRLTAWANRISKGDMTPDPESMERRDEVGRLNAAFEDMGRYLGKLTNNARQIADGDFNIHVEPASDKDSLGKAFVKMGNYLRELAQSAASIAGGDLSITITPKSDADALGVAFSAMIERLRSLALELSEGITVLSSAAQEILTTTTQVATGSQETASAISEITATVEEVKQTASLASEKARNLTVFAKRSVDASKEGEKALDSMQTEMEHIRSQMAAVAESIVRLSDQSQAIGDIVSSVNDLAEQSNLLGVNASIEAVKAGEVGRGFGVVAQEVKILADQSKHATTQVRGILSDIQKAMNKAVMVAEQSSKSVDKGVAQAQVSGQAIRLLADCVENSSDVAIQISASSQQQLVGMDQVAAAIENIKQASQDNVAGAKQSKEAASSLHLLGNTLKEQVAQFRL
ncbi:Methyl-accepting chemotaxis protein [Hahella chejuensis KCTC 2396]|uniref:Methyl-accepting chemotaxis protein n=1 Tax=Hahella chejuensis (strain KCTC 2396) TaxID=349521 RepID=Q2SPK5_HAHCH|nr:HAMP domain-containing methyl-accepting chemotaxis protein [Hahella chejuensis]ABC27419.1 Methyl-accepting chemotaxis protein [Hahella chejuensis KCTC 2396]